MDKPPKKPTTVLKGHLIHARIITHENIDALVCYISAHNVYIPCEANTHTNLIGLMVEMFYFMPSRITHIGFQKRFHSDRIRICTNLGHNIVVCCTERIYQHLAKIVRNYKKRARYSEKET
jgi:hypothetical protein